MCALDEVGALEPDGEARIARFDPAPDTLPVHARGCGRAMARVPESYSGSSAGDGCLLDANAMPHSRITGDVNC